uniref:Regulator of telomere elongation helicase 1 homolog n=1 Tax=Anopheles coluzzii TaxID=1518534 RepID=A0A8W7P0B9_ANOCL
MPEYMINGIPVNFPFEPYELQKNYMAKVIECLQNKTNGVLESPTGTGKTLSLLCSSMAWLLHMKPKQPKHRMETIDTLPEPPELSNAKHAALDPEQALALQQQKANAKMKIIYASRTHSQLSQAMQELKNTSYLFVRSIILGSRDQLCIHPDISKQENNAIKTVLCRESVKARNCSFYNRVETVKDRPDVATVPVMDIEDLVTVGRKLKACPYYLSKELVEQADGGTTHPGTYIFDLLEKANIKFGNINVVLQVMNSLITHITTEKTGGFVRRGAGLQSMVDFLEVVFASSGPEYRQAVEKCFRVHIEPEEPKQLAKGGVKRADGWTATKQPLKAPVKSTSKVINFWCFNPGFGMRQLVDSGTRSIILTSGTLAPLKPFISELSLPVAGQPGEPAHHRPQPGVITHGPDRVELNSSFKNRSNPEYVASLGRTALSLCPIIPGGLLIFFPSYPLLNKCSEEWQASGIWGQISRLKQIFVEPRGKDQFTTTMAEYYAQVRDPASRGAIFMAVCRGKVSEGLDFADANGRAVMITGLPFPPMMDARVVLKKQYLDTNRTRENELITGNDWYSLEASRAVNQAIGRVIRHKDDYGAILLCDSRFQNARQQAQLSAWIHSHLRESSAVPNFGTVVGEMSRFFRHMSTASLPARVRDVCAVKDEPAEAAKEEPGKGKRFATAVKGGGINTFAEKFRLSEYLPDSMKVNPHSRSTKSTGDDAEAGGSGLVTLYKRERNDGEGPPPSAGTFEATRKRRKIVIVPQPLVKREDTEDGENVLLPVKQEPDVAAAANVKRVAPENRVDFLREVKCSLSAGSYKTFLQSLAVYNRNSDFVLFIKQLCSCFNKPHLHYLLLAMRRFIKQEHTLEFDTIIEKIEARFFSDM